MPKNPTINGSFWFPQFSNAKFKGKIEIGEFDTIYLESPSLEQSVNIEKILVEREIVIHGLLQNSEIATFIVLLRHRNETFGSHHYFLILNFRILFAYYGYHFNRIKDIKFNSIIIAFKGLQEWIKYDYSIDISYGKDNKNSLRLGGNKIDIYYKPPIGNKDYKISNRKSAGRVLYVEIKAPNSMKFKDFLDIKSTIQDFFNFFITGESLLIIQSMEQ